MIKYPQDVKAEMMAAAREFCENATGEMIAADNSVRQAAMSDYVYKHCSDRTKAFLDELRAISEYADKHGIMV